MAITFLSCRRHAQAGSAREIKIEFSALKRGEILWGLTMRHPSEGLV